MLGFSEIEKVLFDWNFWEKKPPDSIPRSILESIELPTSDLITAIQGVRRCGKSTLINQIIEHFKLNPKDCFIVNFEDPRLVEHLDNTLLDSIVEFARNKIANARYYYFFLDEIQNVKNWEKWLHMKVERPKNEIFIITGSNASLLSGELATSLTGRHKAIELFPFDYSEFKLSENDGNITSFVTRGGFPRVLRDPNPQLLLREYFTNIIERDVRRHVTARSTTTLFQLTQAIFDSTGSELSLRKLSNLMDVSVDTIHSYIHACEAAYLFFECPYFSFSERQRLARQRKYYPVDLALKDAVSVTSKGLDRGKKLETIVFHQLRKKFKHVNYWRGKNEVDFIVQTPNGILPIQVTWDETKERHKDALIEFKEAFPDSLQPLLINHSNIEEFLLKN